MSFITRDDGPHVLLDILVPDAHDLLVQLASLDLPVNLRAAWDTKERPLTLVYLVVALALFVTARLMPGDVNTLATVGNDILACLGGVLVLRWPTVGSAFYLVAFIISLTNLAESTPTALCIALIIMALAIRTYWAAVAAAVIYAVLLLNFYPSLHPIEMALESAMLLTALGFGAVLRRSRQQAEERDAQAADEQQRLRLRLARELHDSLARSHVLISLRLESAMADQTLSPETRSELVAAQKATAQAVADLGALVGALRSSGTNVMTNSNLPLSVEALLNEQFARLRAEGFTPEANIPDDADSAEIAHLFAPVLIEATTNIIKHGAPGPCRFSIKVAEDTAMLVASNPLATRAGESHAGYGLLGIAERLSAIGGEATWHSHEGRWVLVAAAPLESPTAATPGPDLAPGIPA